MKKITENEFYDYLSKAKSVLELFHLIGYKSNSGVPYKTINKYNNLFNCNIEEIIKKNNKIRKENKNKFDIPHICKNCGNEFTEKYSDNCDGNFCCRSCAAKYSSNFNKEISNKKQHDALYGFLIVNGKKINIKEEYEKNPKLCPICNKPIPYEKRTRKTCSYECGRKSAVLHCDYSNYGGYRKNGGNGKHGWYKGIYCDSTYELAYLIYCLDHNIDIKRCNEAFEYEYEGKKHKYYPDFEVNGELIEIKGYYTDLVDVKASSITLDKPYKILYREDLQEVFEYVAKTYNKKLYGKGQNNFYELYEKI